MDPNQLPIPDVPFLRDPNAMLTTELRTELVNIYNEDILRIVWMPQREMAALLTQLRIEVNPPHPNPEPQPVADGNIHPNDMLTDEIIEDLSLNHQCNEPTLRRMTRTELIRFLLLNRERLFNQRTRRAHGGRKHSSRQRSSRHRRSKERRSRKQN